MNARTEHPQSRHHLLYADEDCGPDHGSAAQTPPWHNRLGNVPTNLEASRHGNLELFSQWTATGPDQYVPTIDQDPATRETKNLVKGQENCNCWWIVTVCAQEVVRSSVNAQTQLTPEQVARLGQPNSRMRARVQWIHSGRGCFVDVDIGGGFRLAIEGCDVDVKIVGPRGAMRQIGQATSNIPLLQGAGGAFLDSQIVGRVVPCWGPTPTGARALTLTQVVRTTAGVPNFLVEVPPFARTLQVSTPGVYAAAPGTNFQVAGNVIRNLPANPAEPQSSFEVAVPLQAQFWGSGAAAAAESYTLVWGLRI